MFTFRSHKFMQTSLRGWLVLGLLLLPLVTLALPARADDQDTPDTDQREVTVLRQVMVGNQVQTTISIPASQATFIASGQPGSYFGYDTKLGVGYNGPSYQALRMLLQFNTGSIPPNATINSATFQIYQYQSAPSNDYDMGLQVQYATAPWSETSTWNTANSIGENPPIGVGNFTNASGWKYGIATNIVRNWYTGAKTNYGVLVIGDEGPSNNRSRWFYSNYQADFYPRLVVDYTIQCDTYPPTAYVYPLPTYSPASFPVSWTGSDSAPSGCPASGIKQYKIWYSTDNANWSQWVPWGTGTSATFNLPISSGTIVYFYAQGEDNAGNKQSVPTAGAAQAITVIDTTPPTASTNPLPQYTVSTNFFVRWSGSDVGSGVRYYNVQYALTEGAWQNLLTQTTLTDYQITGAHTGDTYEFRVQAVDQVGNAGAWSPIVQTIIFANPITALNPISPTILKPTSPITDTIQLSWIGFTPPGTQINQYVVYYNYNNLGWIATTPALPGTTTSTSFNWVQRGLGDGMYQFKVVATNSAAQTEPPPPGNLTGSANTYVDMADALQVRTYLPLVSNNAP
jgi:hypothetical protein